MNNLKERDYIIYDFETNSLNNKLGQILQSAAIRYNSNFELQDTHHENSKLLPYMIPGPKAMEITGITPSQLKNDKERITEFEMATSIHGFFTGHQKSSTSRVYTGYNIFSFDEEVLRATMFRNLLNPYITSAPNAFKLDLYPTIQYMHYVMPGIIVPGKKTNGKESWKLSDVTKANGFNNTNAHDAVADTKMTMELLRILVNKGNEVFEEVLPLSKKKYVSTLLNKNDLRDNYVLQFTHFGEPDVVPLAPVAGPMQEQKTMCIDLSKDPLEWVDWPAEQIAKNVFVGGSPFHMVAPTKTPFIFDKDDSLLAKKINELGYKNNQALFKKRALIVRRDDVVKKLNLAMEILNKEAKQKFASRNFTTEQKIYDGFFHNEETNKARSFLDPKKNWSDKKKIISRMKDPRMIELANRMLATYGDEEQQTIESLQSLKSQLELRLLETPVEVIEDDLLTFNVAHKELGEVENRQMKRQISKFIKEMQQEFKDKIQDLDVQIEKMKDAQIDTGVTQENDGTAEQLSFLM